MLHHNMCRNKLFVINDCGWCVNEQSWSNVWCSLGGILQVFMFRSIYRFMCVNLLSGARIELFGPSNVALSTECGENFWSHCNLECDIFYLVFSFFFGTILNMWDRSHRCYHLSCNIQNCAIICCNLSFYSILDWILQPIQWTPFPNGLHNLCMCVYMHIATIWMEWGWPCGKWPISFRNDRK